MHEESEHECESCPLGEAIERRAFLRDAAAQALFAIGGLSLLGRRVHAMSMAFASGHGDRTDKTYGIPSADGVAIDKDESVIIARFENRVWAFSLACPHQNTAV